MAKVTKQSVFNKVFSAVDYCGDMQRNMTSSDENKYSADFSPNNIRLLVISPEGCLVSKHKSLGSSGKVIKKRYGVQDYQLYVMEQNNNPKGYQPLVGVLSHYRQCSNIEEIILLTQSSNQSVSLDGRELDVTNLVSGYHEHESDIAKRVSSRYKRLAKFSVFDMTFDVFLGFYQQYCRTGVSQNYNLISDLIPDNFKNSLSVDINKEPFASSSSYRLESTYYPDSSGTLKNYFEDIIAKWTEMNKKEKIRKFVDKDKKENPKEKGILEGYMKIVNCCGLMNKLISQYPNYFCRGTLGGLPKVDLFESDSVKELKEDSKFKIACTVVEDGSSDENVAILKKGYYTLAGVLTDFFLDGLLQLNNPILVKYLIGKDKLRTIYNSKSCASKLAEVQKKYGVALKLSDNFTPSLVANLCYDISIVFLQDVTNTKNARSLEYWKKKAR